MGTRKKPEERLQKAVCEFLTRALPNSYRFWHTHQNAPTMAAQRRLKEGGVKPGIPDLFVCGPTGHNEPGVHLVGLELKAKGRNTTLVQEEFLDWLEFTGAGAYVCRSIEDVESALRAEEIPIRATVGAG